MRGSSLLPIVLLLATACASAPRNASDPADRAAAERTIIARSRAVFDAEHSADRAALGELFAPDYRYLSSIGNPDRPKDAELAEQLGVRVESYSVEHARIVWLTPESAALHYFAHQRLRRPRDGRVICPYSGAMEGWARRDGAWTMITRTEWLVGAVRPPACADSAGGTAGATAPGE